jgi:predicted transposase/invertase (TIGR01784 family)
MRHKIDPLVDCVFKAILGKDENKNLLIHFLNAVLEPEKDALIRDVVIKNPYNEKEFVGDKLTVVDVKATDGKGKNYQIEIQLAVHPALAPRILFTWSSIYHSQMQEGDDYRKLNPVISIWILNENLFPGTEAYHLDFSLLDKKNGLSLTDHLAIHILQLQKWKSDKNIKNEKERWLYMLKEGKNADTENPPDPLDTEEMRQAMNVLRRFSENEEDYLLYQNRLDAILLHNTWLREFEDIRKEKEQAQKETEQARKEKEQAEEKVRRLLLLLKEKGIDADEIG